MLLVVAPVEREYAALIEIWRDLEPRRIGRLEAMTTSDEGLVLIQGGLGKAQFAVQTLHAVERLEVAPSLVVCAGTSGALDTSLEVADVVVGTHTVEHDFSSGIIEAPEFQGHAPAIEVLRSDAVLRHAEFALHFGRIASGDEDVASRDRAEELRERTGAMVVAWEGAGGARAAAFSDLPYLEVRGVTDHAGPGAFEDFRANVPRTMASVAHVVTRLRNVSA